MKQISNFLIGVHMGSKEPSRLGKEISEQHIV